MLATLGCWSCQHRREGSSEKARLQYLFNLDRQEETWPQGYFVESPNQVPEVKYFTLPPRIQGKKLFGVCGYWQVEEKGEWIKP